MKKHLLYITAYSLKQFGGAVQDDIASYKRQGLDVDVLSLYGPSRQRPGHYGVFPRTREQKIADFKQWLAAIPWLRVLYHKLRIKSSNLQKPSKYLKKGNLVVVLEDESKPAVSNDLILSKITKEYDYFVLYGWQDMMSSSTVEALYEKYHKPILVPCADMYQLTGNCFYAVDCEKYKNECRNCPVFAEMPNREQAHFNFLFKKRVYNKTGCYIIANSHLINKFLKADIIDKNHLLVSGTTVNTDLYKPLSKEHCRKKFKLNQDKCYLFVRYTDPNSSEYIRKGMNILEESLSIVYSHLSEEERQQIVVMFAGVDNELCKISYDFKTVAIGVLDIHNLIKAYNAATAFVCPSVDDAGPTMVNQSIACGTPVIAFNQGTALDVIEDGYNGFKSQVGDVESFAQCIEKLFRLSRLEYLKMSANAREMSLKKNSYAANDKQLGKRLAYIDNHFHI